ncbi:hypothetical protein [Marinobacterium lacunae]|nr:hypothetical protein [Marinobacterium lacunae]
MSTESMVIDQVSEGNKIIYTVNMNSKEMFCGGVINGMEQLDNLSTRDGTFFSGFNATAFLHKGDNELELLVASADIYEGGSEHRENGRCEAVVNAALKDMEVIELTSLSVDVIDGRPSIASSKKYPEMHRTDLENLSGIQEGRATTFKRNIYIKTIPEWAWTRATPFVENNDNMKKLRRSYIEVIDLMKNKDYKALEAAWSLSSREKALAEGFQSSPEDFFNAIGIEREMNDADDVEVLEPRSWNEYQLKSYMGGKLVRLEDKRGHSPLRVASDSQNWVTSFTPYFSIIDGRLVISR